MDIYELLDEYNKITLDAIQAIEKDKDIEEFVVKREETLSKVTAIDFDKIKASSYANKLKMFENDKVLERAILDKKIEIKKEIELLKKRRLARQNYNNYASKPVYFNRKI